MRPSTSVDQLQKRRFACCSRADQRHVLAGLDRERVDIENVRRIARIGKPDVA
jgi:hypothetical protein